MAATRIRWHAGDVGKRERPLHSSTWPLWPWQSVLKDDRIELLRPLREPSIVPLQGIAALVVTVRGQGYQEVLTLLDEDGQVIAEVRQSAPLAPTFLAALAEVTGCEIAYVWGGPASPPGVSG